MAAGALCLLAVGLTAHQNGAAHPTAWGWSALGLLMAAAVGLGFRDRIELTRLQWGVLAGLGSVLLWIALSAAWSVSVPRTVHEVERGIVYLAALAALFLVASARDVRYVLGGVLGAAVSAAAVALVRDLTQPDDTLPLAGSLPSWNALGLLMAIGIVVAVGLASAQLRPLARIGAIASLAVLAPALYLTHSRGGFLALGAGLLAFVFLHPLLAGHRRRRAAIVLAAAALAVVAVITVRAGGPTGFVDSVYDSIRSPVAPQGRPNEGLLTLSSNARLDYWKVAWDEYREHPWLGSGAGTFVVFWERVRNTVYNAHDAHNLYLEALAELGPVGLALLVGMLALPLLALRASPRGPLLATAFGGYVAYLVHAGVDWDWEVPAVTLAGLFCGGSLVLAASAGQRLLSARARVVGLVALVPVIAFTLVSLLGNATLQAGSEAHERGDYEQAEERARTASRVNPWSSEAWVMLGEAQLALGDAESARESFRTGIRKDPREWSLWYGLARATTGAERNAAVAEARKLNRYRPEVLELRAG